MIPGATEKKDVLRYAQKYVHSIHFFINFYIPSPLLIIRQQQIICQFLYNDHHKPPKNKGSPVFRG